MPVPLVNHAQLRRVSEAPQIPYPSPHPFPLPACLSLWALSPTPASTAAPRLEKCSLSTCNCSVPSTNACECALRWRPPACSPPPTSALSAGGPLAPATGAPFGARVLCEVSNRTPFCLSQPWPTRSFDFSSTTPNHARRDPHWVPFLGSRPLIINARNRAFTTWHPSAPHFNDHKCALC
jgi:hypothetical protein